MEKVVSIALILHLILWAIFFFIAVSDRLTNEATPGVGGLEGWFLGGIYTVLAALAAGGVITSAILFLAARAVLYRPSEEHKKRCIIAFIFSGEAAVFFYSLLIWSYFHLFLYMFNFILVFAFSALWLLCEACCIVFLAISKKKKNAVALT